jgi:2-dehydro-3-deoxyglucarate aldolase
MELSLRNNTLKSKLLKREVTIGSWITIPDEIVAEIMAKKFDWLVIDLEHSAIDLSEAQKLVRIVDLCGSAPLIRVSENDAALIKRAMDTGACGIVVPMVNSKQEAQKAVEAVRYPPAGRRGVGLARAQGYGSAFESYREWLNRESVVIVQIEHVDSVNHLKEILNVPGIDGFIVGPYDLSASLGRPGGFSHPLVQRSMRHVIRLARSMNSNAGIHVIPPDPKEVRMRIRQGYRFIGFSLDTLLLATACQNGIDRLKKARGRK